MNNFLKLAENIDCSSALKELEDKKWMWDEFTLRSHLQGSPHHDTKCIPLRGPEFLTLPAIFNEIEALETGYSEMLPQCNILLFGVLASLPSYELGRVMIVDLLPGGHIDRHWDDGTYAAYYERMHLVMDSHEGNVFFCGDEHVEMKTGELWTFKHLEEHEVFNNSDKSRIHMIIDFKLGG